MSMAVPDSSVTGLQEVRSLSKQLKLAYGSVKQMRDPFQLVLCDPSDALLEALARFSADRWAVQWRHGGRLPDHFDPSVRCYAMTEVGGEDWRLTTAP